MTQASRYRQAAAESIAAVLRRLRPDSMKEASRALREAYCFHDGRATWAYRCWLVERRLALVALAKLRGWHVPKLPQARSWRRRDVPGQLFMFGGGGLVRAA